MDRLDIHNRERRLELALKNVQASSTSEGNKKAIQGFCDNCRAESLSVERIEHYVRILKKVCEIYKKDFVDANKQDMVDLVRIIESGKLAAWTKHDYRVALRKFYKWLRNCEEGYPAEVSWMRTGISLRNSKLPEQLLSEEDVRKLIVACLDAQVKAFVAMLWDSGCRIGELLNLRISNVESSEQYVSIIVTGKTGMRRVPVLFAWPYLSQWLNLHPEKRNHSALVWIKRDGTPFGYSNMIKRLRSLAKKARVQKPINPHAFRHSRATFLSSNLTESQLCQYFGWVQGSKMAATYVHLSGRDLAPRMLELYGLENGKKPNEPTLKPVVCWKCENINPNDAMVCVKCGAMLTPKSVMEEGRRSEQRIDALEKQVHTLAEALLPFQKLFGEKFTILTHEGRHEVNLQGSLHNSEI